MSDSDVEPMDTSTNEPDVSPPSSKNQAEASASSQDKEKEEAHIALSGKWSEPLQSLRPMKINLRFEQILQTWFNKFNTGTDCSVVQTLGDESFVVKIKPVPAVTELQKLIGETLMSKDGTRFKVKSVSLTLPEQEKQIPEGASGSPPPSVSLPPSVSPPPSVSLPPSVSPPPSVSLPPSVSPPPSVSLPPSVSPPPSEKIQLVKHNSLSSEAAVSTAGEETVFVPVSHFWYMSHIYKEEIKRIEKENGIQIDAQVNVTLKPKEETGDVKQALNEFINLVQKCLGESNGSVVALKFIDPDAWSDTMKIIQKNENKALLTLHSQEMTVCGPSQSQEAICKSLTATNKISAMTSGSAGESSWEPQDSFKKIDMKIKDPLIDTGLTFDSSHWQLMTSSFSESIVKIKTKFGVDFKVSDSGKSQGKVNVKVCYKRSGENRSMESHAVRALLRLYQKVTTSPMSFTTVQGASGISGSLKTVSNDYQTEGGGFSGPVFNQQPGHSKYNTEDPRGNGESKGTTDEKCPICIDTFINKRQLKCKHEFCDKCLKQAEKSMGPICPVCKDVFGLMEGNQPDGKMMWKKYGSYLPGFPECGSIEITYQIPSGIQKEKHPKPGQSYYGITRTAYLPDNKDGNEVLHLLKRAFDQKLIFTVGTSRTTGMENQVTWNDIHHKTFIHGGPEGFGYPDPGYLIRVREELKAKGIK